MVETTMDVSGWLRKQLEEASPDLLRAIVKDFAQALIDAEADALCGRLRGALAGAGHASVSTRRVEKLVQRARRRADEQEPRSRGWRRASTRASPARNQRTTRNACR